MCLLLSKSIPVLGILNDQNGKSKGISGFEKLFPFRKKEKKSIYAAYREFRLSKLFALVARGIEGMLSKF